MKKLLPEKYSARHQVLHITFVMTGMNIVILSWSWYCQISMKRFAWLNTEILSVRSVEDHDDLTPIFNRQSELLHNTYGDYFLAELIEAQDADMHCLVAEVTGFPHETCFLISQDVKYSLMLNE